MYDTPTIESLGQGQLSNVQGTWLAAPVAVVAVVVVAVAAVVAALPVYVIV